METTRTVADTQLLADSLGPLPESVAVPTLIIVSGLPGTGKSYFCRKLKERLPLLILESDALRKTLFPTPQYTLPENTRLFQAVHQLISRLLQKSISVVLDATNVSESYRERLYSIAERRNARLIIVRVEAPEELVRERLATRTRKANRSDKSEADWVVYRKMKPGVQKIRRNHFTVDTSRDIMPVIAKIVRVVEK